MEVIQTPQKPTQQSVSYCMNHRMGIIMAEHNKHPGCEVSDTLIDCSLPKIADVSEDGGYLVPSGKDEECHSYFKILTYSYTSYLDNTHLFGLSLRDIYQTEILTFVQRILALPSLDIDARTLAHQNWNTLDTWIVSSQNIYEHVMSELEDNLGIARETTVATTSEFATVYFTNVTDGTPTKFNDSEFNMTNAYESTLPTSMQSQGNLF